MNLSRHRAIFSIIIFALILITATIAIFWARGFKPDFQNRSIERTGLIVASSIPTGARVYLDDRLTSATDTNIAFLEPKTYKIRIEKDGYTTWEKEIEVKADLATEIKALLFPTAPEIKPLTTTGATNPTLSPDGTKIIYAAPGERGGLYLLPMSDNLFPFRQGTRLLAKNLLNLDFSQATFTFSPDSKQAIARFERDDKTIANLLIDTDKTDQTPNDVTASLTATLASWQEQFNSRAQTLALSLPQTVTEATAQAQTGSQTKQNSEVEVSVNPALPAGRRQPVTVNQLNYYPTGLIFSPDEDKVLYQNKEGKYNVYDLQNKTQFTLPDFEDLTNISWYPDSNHLVIVQTPPAGGIVSIIEADGANKMTVFSGKIENGFVFAHPSGSRLIILTSLTQQEGTPPNLYSLNLK